MSHQRSSVAAILVGAGLSLTTAAAAELGAPDAVWIAAGILGVISFVAAILLYTAGDPEASNEKAGRSDPGSHLRLAWRSVAMALAAAGVAGLIGFMVVNIDLPSRHGEAVIVCVDSSASTDRVRPSYLPDLRKVVLKAALQGADFYAANCGANATGNVNWPVRRKFEPTVRPLAYSEAEEVVRGGLGHLVAVRSGVPGSPLGEVLAVMARQCSQAGGNCTIYIFTDGQWSDDALRVRDGVSSGERQRYLKAYLPQLQGLAGSQVNFIGVGYGTSIGEVHLGEARELAADLIEGAGAEMGTWTTRF